MTDRVGRSSDSVGRTSDSVRHSMWRTGEAVRRPRLAGLGASPSVAARQLPLGGSDWIGLLVGQLQAGTLRLLDRRAPFGGGCPRVGAAAGGGRAAAQAGGAGSLPLSRCATAPPRGERLDRVVRGATPGWQALAPRSARSVRRWLPRVGAAAGGGRAAAQVGAAGSLPLSRCATAPPRGERLDRVVRGATPGWQALAPRSARSVRRWLPRVGAAAGGGGGRAAAQVGGVGSLPHSRCATAPPRGERLDRAARGGLQAGRLRLADRRAAFGGGCPEWELPQAEGEAVRRPRLAGLGASPSVAARQLPLGGSDWIGLLGGDCRLADFGSRIGALRSAAAASIGSSPPLPPACAGAGFGISHRRAGGEGIRAADPRIRSATPCGRPGGEGIRVVQRIPR